MKWDFAPLILRTGGGGYLAFGPGLFKLLHFPELVGQFPAVGPLSPGITLVFVILCEVVGGCMLIVGWNTRAAACAILVSMYLGALVSSHDLTIAIIYPILCFALIVGGPGDYSLDARR